MHKYTNLKQRVIAIALCVVLFLSGIQLGAFQNIFATDGYYEFDEFTWRETTAKRWLYYSDDLRAQIGKKYANETIEEIIQMSQDPSIEFDEENFFNGTCFEGLLVEDLQWLYSEGYTIDELASCCSTNGYGHIMEYLFGISLFADGDTNTANYWGDTGNIQVMLPHLNRGTPGNPRPFWFMEIGNYAAFCLDNGKHMPGGSRYTEDSTCVTSTEMKFIRRALSYFADQASVGEIEENESYEFYYIITQMMLWAIMEGNNPTTKALDGESLSCATCNKTFKELYTESGSSNNYIIGFEKNGSYYCYTHGWQGIPRAFMFGKTCFGCGNEIAIGSKFLPSISATNSNLTQNPNLVLDKAYCTNCSKSSAAIVNTISFAVAEYFACLKSYEDGHDVPNYPIAKILQYTNSWLATNGVRMSTVMGRISQFLSSDSNLIEGLEIAVWNPSSSANQRLVTFALPATDTPTPTPTDTPTPTPTPTWSPPPPTEKFRTRLTVIHGINGAIDDEGKGVIATWYGSKRTDEDDEYTVCGYSTPNKSCPHGTETIIKYEIVSNYYLYDKYQEEYYDYEWEDFGGADAHYDWDQYEDYWHDDWEDDEWEDAKYDEETGELIEKAHISSFGTTVMATEWTTFECHYCDEAKSHTVNYPEIEQYTLKLHYQGGWLNLWDDVATQDMNEPDFSGITYGDSHPGNSYTDDLVSEETTNVKIKDLDLSFYELETSSDAGKAGGTFTYTGSFENDANNRKFTFQHYEVDGVRSVAEFSYENYYICSLPTPIRSGYNFVGWYDTPSGEGNKIEPQTVSPDGEEFKDVYVIKEDTELYARWELITKDETFTVYWLDNSNNYTTRPSAVYVELYRYTDYKDAEICKNYITEDYSNPNNADWVLNFSNETGISSDGDPSGGTKKDSYDPNSIDNTIFSSEGTFMIKITGDHSNPAGTNQWQITLTDLQKYDPYNETWVEYSYVVKEIKVESLDETVQYYTSPNKDHDSYDTPLVNYYNIANNTQNNSGQKTLNQYNALPIKSNFSKYIVNRAANVAGPTNWKDIQVTVNFEDGPNDSYDDDIYHFRPYEIKIDLYQNYAYGKDPDSDNFLSDIGVRILYDTVSITHNKNNPWSSSSTNSFGIREDSIPTAGILANKLQATFKNVPTVQDGTCIKIAYDVILTHGQSRYRYTIDSSDPYNNLDDSYASSHYYANKHETDIEIPIDLDYDIMYNPSTGDYFYVNESNMNQVTSKYFAGYIFVEDNFNNIYQDYLKQEDDTLNTNEQNNVYTDNGYAVGPATYPTTYKSMGYNMRYYYISEGNYLRAVPRYSVMPMSVTSSKQTKYLFYKETLYWNFTLTLNDDRTPLPEEYSGSESADDRTGNYNGTSNDDFMHTNNKLTITNKVYNEQGNIANSDNYNNLIINPDAEDFLITLKQVKKNWLNDGRDVMEDYTEGSYSKNGYMLVQNSTTSMWVQYRSELEVPSGGISIGNEYNILLPANGTVEINYIPDGKYELTCHYDIDFDNFNFSLANGTVVFTEENGKAYITLTSKDVTTTGAINHAATIDYWRGYVNDKNLDPVYRTTIKYSYWNEQFGGSNNGFNVYEDMDEQDPDNFYYDYIDENYKTHR